MSIFNKKKTEDEKKTDEKAVKVDDAKKESTKDLYDNKEPKKTAVKKEEGKKTNKKFGNSYKILVRPLITEKASALGAENKYFFEVSKDSNKIEIAKAINEVYGVKPTQVNIIKVNGKKVRHGRIMGKRKDWKKAVITLPKGESIKVYEGV